LLLHISYGYCSGQTEPDEKISSEVVIDGGRTRTGTDGGVEILNTSRALLTPGCALEQVKFKETTTTEKFYASIKYDFGYLKTLLYDNKWIKKYQ
jgi:hypothetical protein